jgi:hypothetical protein
MHHINRFSRLFGGVGLSLAIAVSATPLLSWFPPANPSAQALSVKELWQRGWRNVFGNRRPAPPVPPTGGGSRPVGGGVCAIAPVAVVEPDSSILTPAMVWSDRPTFIWDGKMDKIGVRIRGSENILWSQSVSGTNWVTYAGEALQPDRIYEWLVLSSNNQLKGFFPFRVVRTEERKGISQALQQLDQQLAAEKITGEAATLRRAEFFANQQIDNQPLWSQFWQEVLSVQTPSDKLTGWTRETITSLCNPSDTAVGQPVQ